MKIRSEEIAYEADELVKCEKCGKANPPDRASCLYCASALAVADDASRPVKINLRPLENWENGYNIVLVAPAPDADIAAAARLLKLEGDIVAEMAGSLHPFPLARLESEAEAAAALRYLETLGMRTAVVKDVDLKAAKPVTRLRTLQFGDGVLRLTLFNTGASVTAAGEDVELIVLGRIVESAIEAVEKRKKSERKVVSESATSSDEPVVDIYTTGESSGFRITTKGFDFSMLGAEKGLIAADNMERLLNRLKQFAPGAKLVEEFNERSEMLSTVWPVDRRTDFQGLKRTSVWSSGFSNVVRTSNLEQFTRYSRLQRMML